MTLTSGTHMYSCTHLVNCLYQHSVQTSIFTVKCSVEAFSHTKELKSKFDLAVKVKVNPGSSFEQIL